MKVGIIILGAFLVLYIFGRILQWYDEERDELIIKRKDDEIILANQKELLEIGLGNMVETISVWYLVGFDGWKYTSHNLFWFLVY